MAFTFVVPHSPNHHARIDYSKPLEFIRPGTDFIEAELRSLLGSMPRLLSHAHVDQWGNPGTLSAHSKHRVAFLQGVMGPRFIMDFMKEVFEENGIDCVSIGPLINAGPLKISMDAMCKELERQYEACGKKQITLVCHSLGGIFGLALARKYPHIINKVILYGVPFEASATNLGDITNLAVLAKVMRYASPIMDLTILEGWLPESEKIPLDIPIISIAAFKDGVVATKAQIGKNGIITHQLKTTHINLIARRSTSELGAHLVIEGHDISPQQTCGHLILPDLILPEPSPLTLLRPHSMN